MADYTIREATEDDCEDIMRMITELAVFEKMPDQVAITAEDLKRDAFGPKPFFHAFVAEVKEDGDRERRPLVGYVMYYYTYSPWFGRTCTMEDFYVQEQWRRKGIGSALWASITQKALQMGCRCVHWVVVGWNQSTIDYYKRRGGRDMSQEEGWVLFRMDRADMETFVQQTLPTPSAASINHSLK